MPPRIGSATATPPVLAPIPGNTIYQGFPAARALNRHRNRVPGAWSDTRWQIVLAGCVLSSFHMIYSGGEGGGNDEARHHRSRPPRCACARCAEQPPSASAACARATATLHHRPPLPPLQPRPMLMGVAAPHPFPQLSARHRRRYPRGSGGRSAHHTSAPLS